MKFLDSCSNLSFAQCILTSTWSHTQSSLCPRSCNFVIEVIIYIVLIHVYIVFARLTARVLNCFDLSTLKIKRGDKENTVFSFHDAKNDADIQYPQLRL